MTEEDDEHYRNDRIRPFCDKKISNDKVGDHCHLTVKNRCPAHNYFNINVTQNQSNFIPYILHKFSN